MFEIMSGTIPVLIHIPHDSIAIPNELVDGCEPGVVYMKYDGEPWKAPNMNDINIELL